MTHSGWWLLIESLRELALLTTAGVIAIKWELIHTGEDPRPKIKRQCRRCANAVRRPAKAMRRSKKRRARGEHAVNR